MGPRGETAPKTAAPLSSEAQRKIKEAEKVYRDLKKSTRSRRCHPGIVFLQRSGRI